MRLYKRSHCHGLCLNLSAILSILPSDIPQPAITFELSVLRLAKVRQYLNLPFSERYRGQSNTIRQFDKVLLSHRASFIQSSPFPASECRITVPSIQFSVALCIYPIPIDRK